MAHPSLSQKQATLVNVIALGTIAALALVGILGSTSLERSEADTQMLASPSTSVGLLIPNALWPQTRHPATGFLMAVIMVNNAFHR